MPSWVIWTPLDPTLKTTTEAKSVAVVTNWLRTLLQGVRVVQDDNQDTTDFTKCVEYCRECDVSIP